MQYEYQSAQVTFQVLGLSDCMMGGVRYDLVFSDGFERVYECLLITWGRVGTRLLFFSLSLFRKKKFNTISAWALKLEFDP